MQNTETTESTQPNKPVSKRGGGRRFLFNAAGLIVLLIIAILGGYASGMGVREENKSSIIMQQLGEQYQNALIDIEFGRYENARQRLAWIIENEPSFPGAQEKLTEVLVLSNQPTPTMTPSLTPTPDFSGAQEAFARAQQLIAAQDWIGAIGALDQMRKLDANYEQSKVDGMYYFALRNYGYSLVQQGNLEGGIYQLTLAERFGPLDRDSNGLRVGARQYLIGASFWELDWDEALRYFNDVAGYNLWDGTMSVSERIYIASMRYGDELFAAGQFCDAVTLYQNAQAIKALDNVAAENFDDAYGQCFPAATPTIDPALLTPATPATTEPVTTNTAPTVSAGSDQTIGLSGSANLDGTVSDDGFPKPPGAVTTSWTKVEGPGDVTFGDPNAVDTSVSFSAAGNYILRLTANDSALSTSADVTITVSP